VEKVSEGYACNHSDVFPVIIRFGKQKTCIGADMTHILVYQSHSKRHGKEQAT
jgi:hypothetical protein